MASTSKYRVDLRSLWTSVMAHNGSIAVWRCPREASIHFIGDLLDAPSTGRVDLHHPNQGFVISPFMNPEGHDTLFLQCDVLAESMKDGTWDLVKGGEILGDVGSTNQPLQPWHLNSAPDTGISGEKDHFISMVRDGISAIEGGEFDKVVTARTYDETLFENFHVLDQFCRLEKVYPNAFVSMISIRGWGTWMGATPELLIELSNDHFRTVSVAGTQSFPINHDLSEAAWNQKEIEEQAMVSRYIIEQFKTIRLREFEETGPRSVRAGNMIHLKTEYSVNLNEIHFPELGTVMLHLLHPTSAVCGMPKHSALRFIAVKEHLNREFYSGYLGPVNIDGFSRLYVNLRCMQILERRAILYAGAGITHESNPEREWDETALKCQTLLNVMSGSRSSRSAKNTGIVGGTQ